jgi:hypothetical protein
MRIEPAWSVPRAKSTCPVETRYAEPLDDPPLDLVASHGFGTTPAAAV